LRTAANEARLQEEEMMKENAKVPPPEESAGDVLHAITRIALSSIPAVGGSSTELFNFLIPPSLEKRRKEWAASVNKRLGEVEADVAALVEDQSFVSTVLQASNIAIRTHQEEKLEALRNAVVNSATGVAPEDDMRSFFLNLVDTFTPTHLRILRFFQNRSTSDTSVFNRLRDKGTVADQMVFQLAQQGLIQDPRPYAARMREAEDLLALHWKLSKLGGEFLRFVSSSK